MKKTAFFFALALTAISASVAFADGGDANGSEGYQNGPSTGIAQPTMNTIWTKNYTCAQIQQMVSQDGAAWLQMSVLDGQTVVANPAACGDMQPVSEYTRNTQDHVRCKVGYFCENNMGNGG